MFMFIENAIMHAYMRNWRIVPLNRAYKRRAQASSEPGPSQSRAHILLKNSQPRALMSLQFLLYKYLQPTCTKKLQFTGPFSKSRA